MSRFTPIPTGVLLQETATQATFGFGTGLLLRGGAFAVTRSRVLTRLLGSPTGKQLRRVSTGGLLATAGALETKAIIEEPESAGRTPLRVGAFFTGVALERRAVRAVFPRAEAPFRLIGQEEQLQSGRFTKKTEEVLRETIGVGRVTIGKPQALVPREPTLRSLPTAFQTKAERQVALKLLREEQPEIFGSFGTELTFPRGSVRRAKDIDIAIRGSEQRIKQVAEKELVRRGFGAFITKGRQSIGVGGRKLFDIKPVERLREFPFREAPVKTPSGIPVTKQSEQLFRKIEGAIEGRPKDIAGAVELSEALGREAQAGRIKRITPRAKRLLRERTRRISQVRKELDLEDITVKPRKLEPSRLPSVIRELPNSRIPLIRRPSPSFAPSKPSKISSVIGVPSVSRPSRIGAPSSLFPSVPPSRPSIPPSFPPSVPPSFPPSLPPSLPPSFPPSLPPSLPPSFPPSFPPPLLPPKQPPLRFSIRGEIKEKRVKKKIPRRPRLVPTIVGQELGQVAAQRFPSVFVARRPTARDIARTALTGFEVRIPGRKKKKKKKVGKRRTRRRK